MAGPSWAYPVVAEGGAAVKEKAREKGNGRRGGLPGGRQVRAPQGTAFGTRPGHRLEGVVLGTRRDAVSCGFVLKLPVGENRDVIVRKIEIVPQVAPDEVMNNRGKSHQFRHLVAKPHP